MVKYPTGTQIEAAVKPIVELGGQIRKATKKNKYHARKYELDGHKFDSGLEAKYYEQLKRLKLDFKVHEKFELIPKFKLDGKTIPKATYTPDFSRYEDGKLISVVDTKGAPTMTDAARLRMKLFMKKYQVPVIIATWNRKTKTFNERKY